MSRSRPEWTGKSDDQAIPPSVKIRIFDRYEGHCAVCTRKIGGKLRPAFDHKIALINGGANSENNLQLLCSHCHRDKTDRDLAQKATVYRKRAAHLGVKSKRYSFPCSKSSGWKRKINGKVIRRDHD